MDDLWDVCMMRNGREYQKHLVFPICTQGQESNPEGARKIQAVIRKLVVEKTSMGCRCAQMRCFQELHDEGAVAKRDEEASERLDWTL